jgi:membrane-associated phospholipid phosphatase
MVKRKTTSLVVMPRPRLVGARQLGRRLVLASAGVLALGSGACVARAQGTTTTTPVPPNSAATVATAPQGLLARHPAVSIGVAGTALTLVLFPVDRIVMQRVQRPDVQATLALRNAADAFNFIGGPGFVIAGAGMLGVGFASHENTVTQVGIRASEAIVLNAVVNGLLKGVFGRQRPFVNDSTPNVFGLGKGFTTAGRTSFPSGHTSSSFAFATATAMVLRARSPRSARYLTPALFATATLVGAARVYGAHHWPSDIAAGATVGALSGWLVTRHDVDIGPTSVRWRF